jgi:hypothetical protein
MNRATITSERIKINDVVGDCLRFRKIDEEKR